MPLSPLPPLPRRDARINISIDDILILNILWYAGPISPISILAGLPELRTLLSDGSSSWGHLMAGSMQETAINVHIWYFCSNVCVIACCLAPWRYIVSALEKQASYGLTTTVNTVFIDFYLRPIKCPTWISALVSIDVSVATHTLSLSPSEMQHINS